MPLSRRLVSSGKQVRATERRDLIARSEVLGVMAGQARRRMPPGLSWGTVRYEPVVAGLRSGWSLDFSSSTFA